MAWYLNVAVIAVLVVAAIFTDLVSLISSLGLLVLVLLIFVAASAIYIYLILRLVAFLARQDFIWTQVAEGTAKTVVGADGFIKMKLQYRGFELNDNWEVVTAEHAAAAWWRRQWDRVSPFIGLTGVKFLGIPGLHRIYRYQFRWTSLRASTGKAGETEQVLVDAKEKELDYILVRDDIYYTFLHSAEDRSMVPLGLGVLITLRVTRPYQALFRVQRWLELIENQFLASLRRFVTALEWRELQAALGYDIMAGDSEERLFETLRSNPDSAKPFEEGRAGHIRNAYRAFAGLQNEVLEAYGVRVVKVQINSVTPAGLRGQKYEEAAAKAYEADQERRRIRQIYETVQEFGDTGRFIRLMEAFGEVAGKEGNTILVPLPLSLMDRIARGSDSRNPDGGDSSERS